MGSKKKKNYYAVGCGRKPGIYTDWPGDNGAQAQVKGFPGARYQGFYTFEEARQWLKEFLQPGQAEAGSPLLLEPVDAKKPESKVETPREMTNAAGEPQGNKVIIYTDGCCIDNPGPGGYGAVVLAGGKRKELSAGFRRTTNNRMELLACIEALKTLEHSSAVTLYSDSQYVVKGISDGWARSWKRNGWMRSVNASAENVDLWQQLLELCDKHKVKFSWVKGHAGDKENERCDKLATLAAAEEKNFSRDTAYETGKTTAPGKKMLFPLEE